jgi:signal transduction histidine kinase
MIDIDEELKNKYLEKTEFDLSELISRTAISISSDYQRNNDLKISVETANVSLAEDLLSFALIQLIDNAFKFSSEGTPVIVSLKPVDSGYELSITDNGMGMSLEQIKEIEAFSQIDREKLNQSGNGLGIAIAIKSLAFIGSKLIIESQLNKGTVFKFLIKN